MKLLHGVEEANCNDKDETKKADEAYIASFIKTLVTTATYKSLFRIGKVDPGKKRPIKLIMNSEEDKNKITGKLKNLKDKEISKGLGVSEDYTLAERQFDKGMN